MWLERLLVYFFKECLDHELLNACIYWVVPDQIHKWYQMAVMMDLKLKRCKRHEDM